MYKILTAFTFLSTCLLASNNLISNENVLLAQSVETKNGILKADLDVVVIDKKNSLFTDHLVYDQNISSVDLLGESIVAYKGFLFYSDKFVIDLVQDKLELGPSFFLDQSSQLWLSSKKVTKEKSYIELGSTILSSCECEDPAWNIAFSSGDYDTQKMWINAYNTTLYINGVPVLYSPYFGFPTDTTRRSGLLVPTIGYSNTEGFIYAQPIYWAPAANYDFEITPQIRNQRGHGYNVQFRLADSNNSFLNIKTGKFYESDDYKKENLLENSTHTSYEINYSKSKLISDKDSLDSLYLHFFNVDDVEYFSIQNNDTGNAYLNRYINSYLNYYYTNQDFFSALKFNYYDDLDSVNNNTILQDLPKLVLNKYNTTFLNEYFDYSVNAQTIRKYKEDDVGVQDTSIEVPISFKYYLFDDFLKVDFSSTISGYNYAYTQEELTNDISDAQWMQIYNKVSFSTNLLKAYDSFVHNIDFTFAYNNSNMMHQSGDIYAYNTYDKNLKDYPIYNLDDNYFEYLMINRFYNNDHKSFLEHTLNQKFYYDEDTSSYGSNEVSQQIDFSWDFLKLGNKLVYDYDYNIIKASFTNIGLSFSKFALNSYHLYTEEPETNSIMESIMYDISLKLDKNYTLKASEEYDIEQSINKKRSLALNIDKQCWALNINFVDSLIATNTVASDDPAKRQKIIYFQLDLKKLFQVKQQYEVFDNNN